MSEFLKKLFDTDFMPHVMCLRAPIVIWLHVLSDVLIAIAYLIIPLGLIRLLRIRKDIAFHWMFILFAGFILSCGATHILSVVTLWTPFYRFEGMVKAMTALVSIATAFLLIRLIPQIALLPSIHQWQQANGELKREIADHKNSLGELKKAEQKFQLVVESVPNAMVMINGAGEIQLVNRQTEQWFGYSRQEMIGQRVEMLLPERIRTSPGTRGKAIFAKPIASGDPADDRDDELVARRRDGSEFPIEIGLNPIQTEDGPMVLGAIVDVTERKRMEENIREFNRTLEKQVSERTVQLKNANEDLEEFAFAASHDLKAPLRVIDNCSKWIEEDLQQHLSGETLENMKLLRGRVRRMEKLLDDLLEYARIGRSIDSRYGETIAGDRLMHNILELLAPEGFAVHVSPSFAGLQVRAMPLQQILMNLIGNAIKHHDRGKGSIEVSVEDRGEHYSFAVKDDGPGIPAQFHDQIFKMFQTLRPRDQVEGSGMGLAMVRKHIEIFGGSMALESAEGKGSTFRFAWPKRQRMKGEDVKYDGLAILQTT